MSMAKFSAWCCESDHVDNQWYHDSGSPARCFWCAYSHIRRPGVFGRHFGQQLALQFLHPSTFDNVVVRLWTSKWWGGFSRAVIVCLCAPETALYWRRSTDVDRLFIMHVLLFILLVVPLLCSLLSTLLHVSYVCYVLFDKYSTLDTCFPIRLFTAYELHFTNW